MSRRTEGREWDVLGVGDASVDLYLRVDRLPGHDEKVMGSLLGEYPGGVVANFCCAAARMGSRVALAAVVGGDAYGQLAVESLTRCGVATEAIRVLPGKRTYFCVILLDPSGEKALTVVETDCIRPRRADVDPALFGRTALVHVKGGDLDLATWAAREARRRGALVSVDIEPDASDDYLYRLGPLLSNADVVFPNEAALRQLGGEDLAEGARALLTRGPTVVVVTRGARGALVVTADCAIAVPAFEVPVVDTTGAGDCFTGVFISNYLKGWDLERCARFACAAAAISVTGLGARTALPGPEETRRFLEIQMEANSSQ